MYRDSFEQEDDINSYAKKSEKGYPWLFSYFTPARVQATLVTLFVLGVSGAGYVWYSRYGSDPYPDSIVGLAFAVAGTLCFAGAGLLYTLRRRSRKRGIGKLNAALQWHIAFAVLALALLFMHSFGNFNPRTGTYALYGMIAMIISGFVGRTLDHFMPRLITQEVQKALTAQGEDRITTISRKLQDIVVYNTQQVQPFQAQSQQETSLISRNGKKAVFANGAASWDLAYISLEETPQELSRSEQHYRFVPDRKSALVQPGAMMPGAQAQLAAIQDVQHALQREQFFRYIIRYWRILHICIALITLGLTLWHIEYALTLWLPH
jgi:lipopolysaccharide export LptBFGC system permease protein LptF